MFDQEFFDAGLYRKGTNSIKWDLCQREHGPVLPMWVADMDFPSPPAVQAALLERAAHPTYGYTEAGEGYTRALCGFWKRQHGAEIDPESVVDLPCVVTGLKLAIQTFTQPGDGVIVQKPVYGPFLESVAVTGRREMDATLVADAEGRYHMDLEKVETFCREGAKLMMLCNPHNPVSRAWTRQELMDLVEILNRYHVPLVSDEIHADFVYEPMEMITALNLPVERLMVLCAASKTFNLAGLQMANAVCPDPEIRSMLKKRINENGVVAGNIFGMLATQAAYDGGDAWLKGLKEYLMGNRDVLEKGVREIPGAAISPMEATYLGWLDLRAYGDTDTIMKKCEKAGVVFTGGTFFGREAGNGFVRVNYGTRRAHVVMTLERLREALS